MVKSPNNVKSACFRHVLLDNSAIFEGMDLKLCTHIHLTLPFNIYTDFLKILTF